MIIGRDILLLRQQKKRKQFRFCFAVFFVLFVEK